MGYWLEEERLSSLFRVVKTMPPANRPRPDESANLDILAHMLEANSFPNGGRGADRVQWLSTESRSAKVARTWQPIEWDPVCDACHPGRHAAVERRGVAGIQYAGIRIRP